MLPVLTISKPPLKIVVLVAVPKTNSWPPLSTIVSLALPPDETYSAPSGPTMLAEMLEPPEEMCNP